MLESPFLLNERSTLSSGIGALRDKTTTLPYLYLFVKSVLTLYAYALIDPYELMDIYI